MALYVFSYISRPAPPKAKPAIRMIRRGIT